jgi:hypothetical protein
MNRRNRKMNGKNLNYLLKILKNMRQNGNKYKMENWMASGWSEPITPPYFKS